MIMRMSRLVFAGWVTLGLAVEMNVNAADRAPTEAVAVGAADSTQDVVFLGDSRPVFIRLRLDTGDKGFRSAWRESVKAIHADLDANGDGTLTREELERGGLPVMVRAATGGAAALPHVDLDNSPKDGKVSLEELAEGLRPALGPFRVYVGRVAAEKADALFNHLDRDKNGALSREELSAAVTSLRRFDLDDDEMIGPTELEPFSNPISMQLAESQSSRGRLATVPPVLELSHDDPSFRPVRLILKRYDKGTPGGSPADDNALSRGEFGIDAKDFAAADGDGDGVLDTEELRRYLGRVGPDFEIDVKLPAGNSVPASIEVRGLGGKPLPDWIKVRRLSKANVEVAIGEVNLEFQADGGERSIENARRYYVSQFHAADTDKNQYLEKSELKDHGPFVALFDLMDRDRDGKLYLKEVNEFVDRQAQIARSQIVLSTADQGRAIFAIMDSNRDRQLGEREVRGTVKRVTSWDRNGDGRVSSDEIPHHFQLSIGHGEITGVGMYSFRSADVMPASSEPVKAGPSWFRRMDRNQDGDISPREFLGPRKEFDRLDRDGDGLLSAEEAAKPR